MIDLVYQRLRAAAIDEMRRPPDGVRAHWTLCRGRDEEQHHFGPGLPYASLGLVFSGGFRFRSSRGDHLVDPTTALFRQPEEEHERRHVVPGGDRGLLIGCAPQVVAAVNGGDLKLPTAVGVPPRVELLARQLSVLVRRHNNHPLAEELAVDVVADLIAEQEPARVAAGFPRTDTYARRVLEDAQAVTLGEPALGLLAVASQVGVSPHHLSRLFSRYTGRGFSSFRSVVRINRVLDALCNGEGTLADLAAETGFADHAHLSRTIQRRYGTTPSALRALLSDHNRSTER